MQTTAIKKTKNILSEVTHDELILSARDVNSRNKIRQSSIPVLLSIENDGEIDYQPSIKVGADVIKKRTDTTQTTNTINQLIAGNANNLKTPARISNSEVADSFYKNKSNITEEKDDNDEDDEAPSEYILPNPNNEMDTPSDTHTPQANNYISNTCQTNCGEEDDSDNAIADLLDFISPETSHEIEVGTTVSLTGSRQTDPIDNSDNQNGNNCEAIGAQQTSNDKSCRTITLETDETIITDRNTCISSDNTTTTTNSNFTENIISSNSGFSVLTYKELQNICENSTASDLPSTEYKFKPLSEYIDDYINNKKCNFVKANTPSGYAVHTPDILGDISTFESPFLKCSKSQISKFQLPAFVINSLNNVTLDWYQRRFAAYDAADMSLAPSLQIATLQVIYTYNKEQQRKLESEKLQAVLEEADAVNVGLSGEDREKILNGKSNFKPQPEYKKGWPVLVLDMDLTLLYSSDTIKMVCDNPSYLDKLRRACRKLEWLYDPSGKSMAEHEVTAEHCRQSKSLKSVSSTYSPSDVISALIPSDTYQNKCAEYFPFCCYRPYCLDFLAWASRRFELVLWTASTESYARPRLEYLGLNYFFDAILYRESCTDVELNGSHIFVKDLEKLNRDMDDILILDDTICCGAFQPDRLIPLRPFKVANGRCITGSDENSNDDELLVVMKFLNSLLYARQRGVSIGEQMTENFNRTVVNRVWERMGNHSTTSIVKGQRISKQNATSSSRAASAQNSLKRVQTQEQLVALSVD